MAKSCFSSLLTTGRGGRWNLDIDEVTGDDETLFGIMLSHPLMKLQFSIEELSSISKLLVFFIDAANQTSSYFKLKGCLGGILHFIVDEGRLWIRLTTKDKLEKTELFEVVFEEAEIAHLAEALRDALEGLKENK